MLFALAWAASAAVAWRLRDRARALVRLDLVIGIALVLAFISASRIFGFLWFYLVLWSWSITVLMLVAIGWSIALAVGGRAVEAVTGDVGRGRSGSRRRGDGRRTARRSPSSRLRRSRRTRGSRRCSVSSSRPRREQLDSGDVPGGGPDGRYLVTWTDPVSIGAAGFGLLDALDRRGFDVGVGPEFAVEHDEGPLVLPRRGDR